jgi:hypothetical protein
MTDRPSNHADHDLFLIAELAAGEASPVQEEIATAQIAACNDCATLADDLRALSRATAELPRPARPRDFTLTPEMAARIRRRGWRRLLAAFGTPRFELVRPLAAGLTTLGLAGFLLAAVPGMTGSPSAAPVTGDYSTDGEQRDNAFPSAQPLQGAENDSGRPAPAAGPPGGSGSLAAGDPDPEDAPAPETPDAARLSARPASPLVVLSGSFLIVGLGLFALRWTARRLGDG